MLKFPCVPVQDLSNAPSGSYLLQRDGLRLVTPMGIVSVRPEMIRFVEGKLDRIVPTCIVVPGNPQTAKVFGGVLRVE